MSLQIREYLIVNVNIQKNQKQELPVVAMFGKWIITKCALFREDLP
jgi:hypothetical protein